MGDEELKKTVQETLIEVEQKLLISLPGSVEKLHNKRRRMENEVSQSQYKLPMLHF